MTDVILARAIHVLGVVLWIGGLGLATLVLIPALRADAFGAMGQAVFHAIERRFIWIARAAAVAVGLTGFHMVARLDAWDRFATLDFWWMQAMLITWVLFMLLLFVGEPFVLHRYLEEEWRRNPRRSLAMLYAVHLFMLAISLVTVAGAVIGGHGGLF